MATKTELKQFIEKIAPVIVKLAKEKGYKFPSAIIAQACHESNSSKGGFLSLATKYHNYHGMKCGSKWTGTSVNLTTKEEYKAGTLTTIKDNFRTYSSMEEGLKGYFDFITLSRYSNLKSATSSKHYLELIKADGYATDSKYVASCYKYITDYDLEQYDKEEVVETPKPALSQRHAFVELMRSWVGKKESDGSHKSIIDLYNSHKPLARGYKVKYTDAWCATTVSAAAIGCKLTSIIPTECSCGKMIELLIKAKSWQEADHHIPETGDIIFYDWDDTGKGDNKGWPEHVGVVEKVDGDKITVIEGNISDAVGRRIMSVNGRFIRGYGIPKFTDDVIEAPVTKEIKKGSKVKVLKAVQYSGKSFKVYYKVYDVLKVDGNKVVIGIGKTATCVIHASNLELV